MRLVLVILKTPVLPFKWSLLLSLSFSTVCCWKVEIALLQLRRHRIFYEIKLMRVIHQYVIIIIIIILTPIPT